MVAGYPVIRYPRPHIHDNATGGITAPGSARGHGWLPWGVPGWGWQHSLRIKVDSIAPTLTGHVGMAIYHSDCSKKMKFRGKAEMICFLIILRSSFVN